MPRILSGLIAGIAILCAFPLNAATFVLEHRGDRLVGGEICMFDAEGVEDPVERLTTFTEVRCQRADEPVSLPQGTWNVFARHRDGFVSPELRVAIDGRLQGSGPIQMERAAIVDFGDVQERGSNIALYIESTGAVIPLGAGETTALIPLQRTAIPFRISANGIRVGDAVEAEERVTATTRSRGQAFNFE